MDIHLQRGVEHVSIDTGACPNIKGQLSGEGWQQEKCGKIKDHGPRQESLFRSISRYCPGLEIANIEKKKQLSSGPIHQQQSAVAHRRPPIVKQALSVDTVKLSSAFQTAPTRSGLAPEGT
jgi:hypothetical protein